MNEAWLDLDEDQEDAGALEVSYVIVGFWILSKRLRTFALNPYPAIPNDCLPLIFTKTSSTKKVSP